MLRLQGVRIVQDLKWIIGPGSDDEASQAPFRAVLLRKTLHLPGSNIVDQRRREVKHKRTATGSMGCRCPGSYCSFGREPGGQDEHGDALSEDHH